MRQRRVCTSVITDAASSLVYQGTLEDETMEEMSRALLAKDEELVPCIICIIRHFLVKLYEYPFCWMMLYRWFFWVAAGYLYYIGTYIRTIFVLY